MKKQTWVVIGHNGERWAVSSCRSARSATTFGREMVETGTWKSFRVARVTSEYKHGAVRVK